MKRPWRRILMAVVLSIGLVGGVIAVIGVRDHIDRVNVVGYFANSNGVYVGDDVQILGVPVGKIERIEPQDTRVKISFWFDGDYQVPADANAAILSPTLVPVRAIQLTPAYTGGPTMADNTVIPQARTAVPVEFDDLREQLQRLTTALEPSQPGGVSSAGALINTTADNLRGQGEAIRKSIIAMSEAFSALGDHSDDVFSTVKNLSILVTALQDSTTALRLLNQQMATATSLLANDPAEIDSAIGDLNSVIDDVRDFVAANRETLGTTSDKVASVSAAVAESLPDLKETLHMAPNTLQNFINIYHPAKAAFTGAIAINGFENPLAFICGAVEATSRLGAEKAAKLCVQYLAPIFKNRQYNFPPIGENLFVGAKARPNELTYSEDWMRPDYLPPQPIPGPAPTGAPLAAEAVTPTPEVHHPDPALGLPGMLLPAGSGP